MPPSSGVKLKEPVSSADLNIRGCQKPILMQAILIICWNYITWCEENKKKKKQADYEFKPVKNHIGNM